MRLPRFLSKHDPSAGRAPRRVQGQIISGVWCPASVPWLPACVRADMTELHVPGKTLQPTLFTPFLVDSRFCVLRGVSSEPCVDASPGCFPTGQTHVRAGHGSHNRVLTWVTPALRTFSGPQFWATQGPPVISLRRPLGLRFPCVCSVDAPSCTYSFSRMCVSGGGPRATAPPT